MLFLLLQSLRRYRVCLIMVEEECEAKRCGGGAREASASATQGRRLKVPIACGRSTGKKNTGKKSLTRPRTRAALAPLARIDDLAQLVALHLVEDDANDGHDEQDDHERNEDDQDPVGAAAGLWKARRG